MFLWKFVFGRCLAWEREWSRNSSLSLDLNFQYFMIGIYIPIAYIARASYNWLVSNCHGRTSSCFHRHRTTSAVYMMGWEASRLFCCNREQDGR
jgi:hypothetical protein